MSVTTQLYSEQTSPTTTFSSQSATSVSFAEQTGSTVTYTEKSPTLDGTLFGEWDYDTGFYQAQTLIMGRR